MSKTLYKFVKRFFDILFSISLLIFLSPLLLVVSFLIWITDGGGIFVKEPLRKGKGGVNFKMYKFRTMIPDAHSQLLNNPKYKDLKAKWGINGNKMSIQEDSRITRIGRILRKCDIDELPQLINVLLGEMSIVGPRPSYDYEIAQHLKKYPNDKKYLKQIFTIRPGITGIWQVSGRNDIKLHNRFIMEARYVKEMNFLTDLKILLKTPIVVLTRKGAYE
ncbi:MAG TPA: sugar transferase [Candidatus Dojkabacteria bacterium]|nr:sugar transferase [Candidatus Dojkabacteria bacterium]